MAWNVKQDESLKKEIPTLNQIYFYLTEGCNLACRHCWLAPKLQKKKHQYPVLDFDLFRSIVEQGKKLGMTGVKLTGGEPLMHPDIEQLLKYLIDQDVSVTIETNGVLCTPEVAMLVAKNKNVFVSVSLDGTDSRIHESIRGVKGCFEEAIQGIRNLVNAGIAPQIIMTLMRRNKHQIEAMVRLGERLGAHSVKFNMVQPTERGKKMHELDETPSVKELIEIGKWVEETLAGDTQLKLYYDSPAAFRPLSRLYGQEGTGCNVCGILGILGVLADGSYSLCGIGSAVSELVFGHASRDRLDKVWKETKILEEIREGMPKKLTGVCASCLMVGSCFASCLAQNYYRTRNIWAPFWFCDLAFQEGIFPQTRLYKKQQILA
ncbi:SynChlorMet cassette radical SAM/SPASM protein ScmF [candidate division KSB1 bacterium]|nr:SynChlorMet cassette radical SAM/SPASM protein ScmF [candidate division KSB1 bacterium]